MRKNVTFSLEKLSSAIAMIWFCSAVQALAQCDNTTVLSITGPSTSTWTAPASGGPFQIRITATGGAGGAYLEANPDRTGGTGATMSGTFVVQNGQTIRAIAGGGGFHSQLEGGGGGGASGAVNCGNPSNCGGSGVVLIVAAAGNGGQLGGPNGGFGEGGSSSTGGDGDGGLIADNDSGGGGGALNGPGQSAGSGGGGGGQIILTGLAVGGQGSSNMTSDPPSGFNHGGDGMGGGGGGGDGADFDTASGGGGGHSGGDAGNALAASSFNSGDDPADSDGATGAANSGPKSTPANPGTVTIVCLAALPVELINFKVVMQKSGGAILHWSTVNEKDNHGFDIERSLDNRHWASIGFVPGSGTSSIQRDYTFTDKNPLPGVNYYRLKQMDTDGEHEYSPMVVADVRHQGLQFDVFPNPSTEGHLSIRAVNEQEGDALLEIYDWAGYKVFKETIFVHEGTTICPISLATFPKGSYTVRLEMPDGSLQFRKIFLQ